MKNFSDLKENLKPDIEVICLDEAATPEQRKEHTDFAKKIKAHFKAMGLDKVKVRVSVNKNENPYIDVWSRDVVIPNDIRKKAVHANYGNNAKLDDDNDINYGNIRQNSIALPYSQWKTFLGESVEEIKEPIKEDIGVVTNVTGAATATDVPVVKRETFAKAQTFEVDADKFYKCMLGKNRYHRYDRYVGDDETGNAIREYGKANPAKSIVVKHNKTGSMFYLRKGLDEDLEFNSEELALIEEAVITEGENLKGFKRIPSPNRWVKSVKLASGDEVLYNIKIVKDEFVITKSTGFKDNHVTRTPSVEVGKGYKSLEDAGKAVESDMEKSLDESTQPKSTRPPEALVNGEWHMTRAQYNSIHKDYKGKWPNDKYKYGALKLVNGGTQSVPVVIIKEETIEEAKKSKSTLEFEKRRDDHVMNFTVGEIAKLSGLRAEGLKDFIVSMGIDPVKLIKSLQSKKYKPVDLATAVSGTPNNKYAEECRNLFPLNEEVLEENSVDAALNAVDSGDLDSVERMQFKNYIKTMSKAAALKILINTAEGDLSQLSPVLAKIASKYKIHESTEKCGYVGIYKGKRGEVYANSKYEAQQLLAKKLGAKKAYDVNVALAEKDGKDHVNIAEEFILDESVTDKELPFEARRLYAKELIKNYKANGSKHMKKAAEAAYKAVESVHGKDIVAKLKVHHSQDINESVEVELDEATSNNKINQKDYTFYVIVKDKIESGWEYKEDAKDQVKDNLNDSLAKLAKVLTKQGAKNKGIDPDKNESWLTHDEAEAIAKSDGWVGPKVEESVQLSESVEDAVNTYMKDIEELYKDYYKHMKFSDHMIPPKFIKTEGGKMYKIIMADQTGKSQSVFGFIDKTTGDVYKAAGWKAPAKGIRGNVLSPTKGIESLGKHFTKGQMPHIVYLK